MLKLTQALKQWLIDNRSVKADATDDEFKKAALQAMLDTGEKGLTEAKLVELTADPDAKAADTLEKKLDLAIGSIGTLANAMSKQIGGEAGAGAGNATGTKGAEAGAGGKPALGAAGDANAAAGGQKSPVDYLEKMFAGSDGIGTQNDPIVEVRVKGAWEQYEGSRKEKFFPALTGKGAPHPYAGRRLAVGGTDGTGQRFIDEPSQRDKALMSAFIKAQIQHVAGIPRACKMTDHDRDLFRYALANMDWGGTLGGDGDGLNDKHLPVSGRKLTPHEQKFVIDDATSGGLYAAPIFFDDMFISTPLLFGEFFPSVNVVPITRGRRVEGFSMSNLSLSGGGFDGTDIPLFTTTAFIAAFNTTIFVCNGAVEIGLDFLSDSPVDVANAMTEQYGRVLLNYLDRNIAAGDGTTQPTGITIASGTVSVAGGSAAPTVGVYESFFFGVTKKYKQGYPNERIMFGANETTYQRARAIAVSGSDARRIFGMTHGDYMLMGHKYGISDTLANTRCFFANMARYRLYRRLGQTVKVTTEGKTLTRGNLMLLTARSRWGGQPEDGSAFAISTTMQA